MGTLKVRAMKALPAWFTVLNIDQTVEEITLNSALWFATSKSIQQIERRWTAQRLCSNGRVTECITADTAVS